MTEVAIDELRKAVLPLPPCKAAVFVESVQVREEWQGRVEWEGSVHVFDLDGRPSATRAYAWSHLTDDRSEKRRFVVGLPQGKVDAPINAVRASIGQETRERGR